MLQKVQLRATDNTEQTKAARQKLANSTKNTQATQPKAPVFKGRPVRNEPCPCGSGKNTKIVAEKADQKVAN